jgi:AcrR family transcriptional regulator
MDQVMHDQRPKLRTARDRARTEVTNEIKTVARRQLAAAGASALSLRSVAREVGMVSSAVYRYFPSRDDLLTALIVDAYHAVGAVAQAADRAVAADDLLARWLAVTSSVRRWALDSPHEHGLIFGTPVPGYLAPVDTIDPAVIVPLTLLQILAASAARGAAVSWAPRPIPTALEVELAGLRAGLSPSWAEASMLSDAAILQGIMAWTQLIGMISFELFGHLHNVIEDHETYFTHQMRNIATDLGLS